MSVSTNDLNIDSWLVSAGREKKPGRPLNVPPVLASNYLKEDIFDYSRSDGTPTWDALEEIIGVAEKGESLAFSSGMAAITAVFDQVKSGSTVVISNDCYQGVAQLAEQGRKQGRWTLEKLPVTDTEAWLKAAKNVDLLWIESPSNPLLKVIHLILRQKQ